MFWISRLHRVLSGYNGKIMGYGQTRTGKTFTLANLGNDDASGLWRTSFLAHLRCYHEEVDNLTKRAKFGENVFLHIKQKLYEAPHPYPVVASVCWLLCPIKLRKAVPTTTVIATAAVS
ncbi:protein CASP, partial [Tanacetum coccineum]